MRIERRIEMGERGKGRSKMKPEELEMKPQILFFMGDTLHHKIDDSLWQKSPDNTSMSSVMISI